MIKLKLPFPISVNRYYKHTRKGVNISEEGMKFRRVVSFIVAANRRHHNITNRIIDEPVEITVEYYPDNNRVHDIDNPLKCLFDSLTKAQVWTDDKLVKKCTMIMNDVDRKKGYCLITIDRFYHTEI